jgi:hypothetical protein
VTGYGTCLLSYRSAWKKSVIKTAIGASRATIAAAVPGIPAGASPCGYVHSRDSRSSRPPPKNVVTSYCDM